MATASKLIMDIMETEASVDHQMDASTMNLRLLVLLIRPRAQKSTDHVNHVSSGPAELRPHRPPDHVAMMITAKNGATTIATTVMATGRKARGPDNFIATGQMGMRAVQ